MCALQYIMCVCFYVSKYASDVFSICSVYIQLMLLQDAFYMFVDCLRAAAWCSYCSLVQLVALSRQESSIERQMMWSFERAPE